MRIVFWLYKIRDTNSFLLEAQPDDLKFDAIFKISVETLHKRYYLCNHRCT